MAWGNYATDNHHHRPGYKALKIAGYRLGRQVAEDEFSRTCNALSIEDNRLFTIRIFDAKLSSDKTFCTQFGNITRFLSGKSFGIMTPLKHSAIDEQGSYVISEYFSGYEHANDTLPRYPVDQLLATSLKLASTLTQLHQTGLVHGGIEPASMVFHDQNRVVLAPLALERVLLSLRTRSLSSLATHQQLYLAPEAMQELTAATDFYALGVVLYQLVSGCSPFSASDGEALLTQKKKMQILPLAAEYEFLSPFFQQLLQADASKRTHNAMQFRQTLSACGFKPEPQAKPTQNNTDTLQAATDSAVAKKPFVFRPAFLTILVLTIAGLAYLQIPGSESASIEQQPNPAVEKVSIPAPVEKLAVEKKPTREKAIAFYQQALQQYHDKQFGSALISINQSLKEDPFDQQATHLESAIQLEIEVQSIISEAEQQIEALKLTRPPGDNALESYQRLDAAMKVGDKRQIEGFRKIADKFHELASVAFSVQQLERSEELVTSGLAIVADHDALLRLRSGIIEQQQRDAEQRTREKRNAEQQRIAAAEARERRQRQINIEQQKQAAEKKRELEQEQRRARLLSSQQEQKRESEARLNQARVDRLVMSARSYLAATRLNLHTIDVAREDYLEAASLAAPDDDRIPSLRQDIISAYGNLVNTLKDSYQYDLASSALTRALSVDDQDPFLNRLKDEINTLVNIRNQNRTPR